MDSLLGSTGRFLELRTVVNENKQLLKSLISKSRPWCYSRRKNGIYSECIYFTGCKSKKGYGQLTCNRASWLAHRASHYLFNGDMPKGMFVLHKCDRPSCVNPDHLYLGTAQDNSSDMVNKKRHLKGRRRTGRAVRGEKNRNSKISTHQARKIKVLVCEGKGCCEILKVMNSNVTRSIINDIKRNKSWNHIKPKRLLMKVRQMSFRFNEEIIKAMKMLALKNNQSLALYVETVFAKHLKEQLSFGNIKEEDYGPL